MTTNNKSLATTGLAFTAMVVCIAVVHGLFAPAARAADRPNIFFAISDDQSWPHASAYGSKMVQTPNFDRIAHEGVLFTQAFCPAPGCSPCRASVLTGRQIWQIEHAGTHASSFAAKYVTFPDALEAAGYFVGYTGKGWGPGNFKISGRTRNPAGPNFSARNGYVPAFADFLTKRPKDKPFCFWFGSYDPHRGFKAGSGLEKGKKLTDAEVPAFLPDVPEIRTDLLDYAFEVERFDTHVGEMIALMKEAGVLDNTLVIVTSDNGMPFPRAKANCYEYGIHMPLAIRWAGKAPAGRSVDDLVGFVDLTATIYDVTGVDPPTKFPLAGRSIKNILTSKQSGIVDPKRDAAYSGRERHSSVRFNSLGYPQRCIRTHQYLYIRNFKPERWPGGAPQKYNNPRAKTLGPMHAAYNDVDGGPTLSYLAKNAADPKIAPFLQLAVAHRPAEELFDIRKDPYCLNDLAKDPAHAKVKAKLSKRLLEYLAETGDARVTGNGDIWETYPRYAGPIRWYPQPDWAKEHPEWVPKMDWVEERRPKANK